jgi:hypothetical protein
VQRVEGMLDDFRPPLLPSIAEEIMFLSNFVVTFLKYAQLCSVIL